MSTHREIMRKADGVIERAREAGTLDRRAFMRCSVLGLSASVLSACNSAGPDSAFKLLAFATRSNERFERWLLGHNTLARTGGITPAGSRFPAYWVSRSMPVWDTASRGTWRLEVTGAVKTPRMFTLDDLRRMRMTAQRVPHYCVEGWTAVADFTGVPMRTLLETAPPNADAKFVDFPASTTATTRAGTSRAHCTRRPCSCWRKMVLR